MYIRTLISTWGGIKPAIEAGPKGPVFKPIRWVWVPLLILAVLTIGERFSNFDFEVQKAIYSADNQSWGLGERSLWSFLYKFGTVPAILCFGAAGIGYLVSLYSQHLRRWRQCFVFIILLGAIGPGVVTNLILKEYWGRPRPRSVEGLGGINQFEEVLTIDKASGGKSFPCGHSTMGYFFVGGFFLLRRYRRDWAWFSLIFGLTYGFFIGVARMCKGGHFFSDVIWAGAIMYFVAMLLYYDLNLHKGITQEPKAISGWMKVTIPIVGALLSIGILLATPYRETKARTLSREYSQQGPLFVKLTLKAGQVTINPSETFAITGETWGHGAPTSKLAITLSETEQQNETFIHYHERISGWFVEVGQELHINLPWHRVRKLTIDASECDLILNFPEQPSAMKKITFIKGDARVLLRGLNKTNFSWRHSKLKDRFGNKDDFINGKTPELDVRDTFTGTIECSPP